MTISTPINAAENHGAAKQLPGASRGWPKADVHQLDNGMSIVVIPLPHLRTAAISLYVRAGSLHEQSHESGLNHLVEHALFRGCQGFPDAYAFNSAFEACSMGLSAATYRDFTVFETLFAPEKLERVFRLLSAMMTAPLFVALDIEKKVVLEEISDSLDEKGRDVDVDDMAKALLFPNGGMGRKIGGTPSSVENLGIEDCRRWFETRYTACNMVLAVAGDVKSADVLSKARQSFAALPAGVNPQRPHHELRGQWPAFVYRSLQGAQTTLQLCWPLPPEGHEDWPEILMAYRLLDDGSCARLRHSIVDQLGLAYQVSADLENYVDHTLLIIEATANHRQVVRLTEAILEVTDSLFSGSVTDEEWERIRARYSLELRASLDSPAALAAHYGNRLLYPRAGLFQTTDDERFMAVSPESFQVKCDRHLRSEQVLMAVVGDLSPMERSALRRLLYLASSKERAKKGSE